jgi:hypothetical protein
MGRYQQGHIFETSGSFHIRYYTGEKRNGRPVDRSERLCAKDNKHFSTTCKAVKQLAAVVMERVNAANAPIDADQPIVTFWEQIYLPFIEENKKPSAVAGYKQIWNQHLKAHFEKRTLQEYRTSMLPVPSRSYQEAGTAHPRTHSQSRK